MTLPRSLVSILVLGVLSMTPDLAAWGATDVVFSATPTYQWDASIDAVAYFLWVGNDDVAAIGRWYSATELGCANGGTCRVMPDTPLTLGAWRWWVMASDSSSYSPRSAEASFAVSAPDTPTLIAPVGAIATSVPTFQWTSVTGATWYRVLWFQWSVASGTGLSEWYEASALGCPAAAQVCALRAAPALAAGATMWWWVQSANPAGASGWSPPAMTVNAGP